MSPGRQAWELKANATFRSAEGPSRSAKRGATRKNVAARSAEQHGKFARSSSPDDGQANLRRTVVKGFPVNCQLLMAAYLV